METFNSEIQDLKQLTQVESHRNASVEKENREANWHLHAQVEELKKVVLEVSDLVASELDQMRVQTSRDQQLLEQECDIKIEALERKFSRLSECCDSDTSSMKAQFDSLLKRVYEGDSAVQKEADRVKLLTHSLQTEIRLLKANQEQELQEHEETRFAFAERLDQVHQKLSQTAVHSSEAQQSLAHL